MSVPRQRRVPAVVLLGQWGPRSAASTSDGGASEAGVLLARLGTLAASAPGRATLRDAVVQWHLPMAAYLARRFSGRGEPLDDLTQVAVIGLIKAVDRFDADRGVDFASYAIPTILGEIKRHFRDKTWNVRVPRRLQELRLHMATVTEDLSQALQRSPTTNELAGNLGVRPNEVLAARRCANAYRPISFDQETGDSDDLRLLDSLGALDPDLEAVDRRESLRLRMLELPERERRIIGLRFFADMTQAQIAADIGVSQMQVSRLLSRSLTHLQAGMLGGSGGLAS